MHREFKFNVETFVEQGVDLRRFRWCLQAPGEVSLASNHSFATKREAVKDAEVALQRAHERGRLRP